VSRKIHPPRLLYKKKREKKREFSHSRLHEIAYKSSLLSLEHAHGKLRLKNMQCIFSFRKLTLLILVVENMFMFQFKQACGKRRVLDGEPWRFDKFLLARRKTHGFE
jgi:hypothetical protein